MKMRLVAVVCMLLFLLAFIPSCTKEESDQGRKAGEAIEETDKYMEQDRADFERDAGERLAALEEELADLKSEAEARGREFADAHKEQLYRLEQDIIAARVRLEELRKSGSEAWSHLKSGFDKAMGEMEDAFKKAADEFRK